MRPNASSAASLSAAAPCSSEDEQRRPSCGSPNLRRFLARHGRGGSQDRPPDDAVLRRRDDPEVVRQVHTLREPLRQPVREPEVGIGFGDRRRDPLAPRREHHRPADVATGTEHDVGTPPLQDPAARGGAPGRDRTRGRARRRSAAGARSSEEVDLVPGVRDQPRFDAIRRSGEGHLHPSARSSSATASAGSTCPAVPPAAITHVSSRSATRRDVKEDTHGHELDNEARAAVGDERQRNPGQRREAQHCGQVDGRLTADERRQAGGQALAEGVAHLSATVSPAHAKAAYARITSPFRAAPAPRRRPRRSCPCAPRGGSDLLHALTEPLAEESARAEADLRLDRLEARALRIAPRVEEGDQPRAPVRLDPDRHEHDCPAIAPAATSAAAGVPETSRTRRPSRRSRSSCRGPARAGSSARTRPRAARSGATSSASVRGGSRFARCAASQTRARASRAPTAGRRRAEPDPASARRSRAARSRGRQRTTRAPRRGGRREHAQPAVVEARGEHEQDEADHREVA